MNKADIVLNVSAIIFYCLMLFAAYHLGRRSVYSEIIAEIKKKD